MATSYQVYNWPVVSVSATNPSVGPDGNPIPGSATLIGGENPSGNLEPLKTDAAGNLLVSLTDAPLEPLEVEIVGPIGSQVIADSVAVAVASDQIVNVDVTASVLPPDAATETTLLSVDAELVTANGHLTSIDAELVTVNANLTCIDGELVTANSTLSTLATEATLSSLDGKFNSLGQKNMAGSAPVVIASDQSTLPVSAASLPLPSGAATEATLSSLDATVAARLAGSLVPSAYDYIALTYVTMGNGIGQVETATYKLGGSGGTTVKTLTLTYDGDDKLSSVTAS